MKKLVAFLLSAITAMTSVAGGAAMVYAEESQELVVQSSVVVGLEDVSSEDEGVILGDAQQEPEDVNPLTGEAGYDVDAIGNRPVAVMINNHPNSYPQYNVSQADVIFEVVVEHGLSRFMALFADYENVPYLVSVRSYRYYFPQISQGFDAFYIHWGEDTTMWDYYLSLDMDSYDGLSNTYLFGRDQERLDWGYDLEHTSALYGYLIPDQVSWDGLRTELKEEYLGNAFNFVPYGTVRIPGDESCLFAYINYGVQTTQFTYDSAAEKYLMFSNEESHYDGISGEQLAFTNVLILYTDIEARENDEADRQWLDVYGGLDVDYAVGYYLSEGSMQPIRWAKDGAVESGRLRFYDMDGNEITINRGKTYITYTYQDSASLSDEIPEAFQN